MLAPPEVNRLSLDFEKDNGGSDSAEIMQNSPVVGMAIVLPDDRRVCT